MNWDIALHVAELLAIIFGIALPEWRSSNYLKNVFKNFPPHRHTNGGIIYPAGYVPPRIQHSVSND